MVGGGLNVWFWTHLQLFSTFFNLSIQLINTKLFISIAMLNFKVAFHDMLMSNEPKYI